MKKCIFAFILISITVSLYAGVNVAIVPQKDAGPRQKKAQKIFTKELQSLGGIDIVEGKMLKKIMKIHEKAMAAGSSYHDISNLRAAEYLMTLEISPKEMSIKAVDVNTGTVVFSDSVGISVKKNRRYRIKSLARRTHRGLLTKAASKEREIPSEGKPYMDILQSFANSLKGPREAQYRHLVFYYKGKYTRPTVKNTALTGTAKRFIAVVRPALLRAKIEYLYIKPGDNVVYLFVATKKFAKKSTHRFGIVELSDGSLAISTYDPM